MALLGEPLDAMVQNLGQTNNSHVSAGSTNKVVSQGFTTGSDTFGYRLQGIGVNIEGSSSNYPDGPTSVSVAVHEDSRGRPGRKLFDLVSPDEFGAGHSFFEAPPGTHLAPDTSYVLVWSHLRGTTHRLQRTASNSEDSGKATGSSIANAFYRGADLGSRLSEDPGGNSLEIGVYTEVNTEREKFAEFPEEPTEPPFEPGLTGGGGAILRCSVPPAERCPTYDHFVPAEHIFLSTTMTVGTRPNVGGQTVLGWDDLGRFTGASLADQNFTFGGNTYEIERIQLGNNFLALAFDAANAGDIATQATRDKLTLHFGSDSFNLGAGILSSDGLIILWSEAGLAWSASDSVQIKITEPHPPNAYGYRTIWTALMTAEADPNATTFFGYEEGDFGEITNNLMVDGRDESIRVGTPDQPRYPWIGYEIDQLQGDPNGTYLYFKHGSHPEPEEAAGWTLTLGGGIELPFADATNLPGSSHQWAFSHVPGWTAGDQVLVSIRNDEVQNRMGQVKFKSRRYTSQDSSNNIVYGKTHFSYDREPNGGKFGPADGWELRRLNVTTDKTGDTDPVGITATFRARGSGAAGRAWQGYWEGQFDDFHTLFLRWIYHEDGKGKGEATYTLPLRAANGIALSQSGRDVTFTWVLTYKEFQRRHLDLANHSERSAHMLAPPQPATARAGG